MSTIGLMPGSYKPLHAGHYAVIQLVAKENDRALLFVSTSDRDNVSGQAMAKIWKEQIEPTLPDNVEVTYGGSPVGNVWKTLGEADKAGSTDTFVIYSDDVDVEANYPDDMLIKYAPDLFGSGQIVRRPVKRSSTVNISGGKMREFLASGDKKSFLKYLPKQIDGNAVWDTLLSFTPVKKALTKKKTTVKSENFLRRVIKFFVS